MSRGGGPWRRLLRLFVVLGAASISVWLAGFVWFTLDALRPTAEERLPQVDGIVVLTGGQGRIEAAARLVEAGRAPRILITGVGSHATASELADQTPALAAGGINGHLTLGHKAVSTVGNAVETRDWVRSFNPRRLIIVTAGYHMRRALLEIGRSVPGVALIPCRVRPPALRHPFRRATLRLMALEYDKWIGALLGLQRQVNLVEAG
ncbi:hypothetical protein AA103196_2967 [Ameyamaea chiangmaiensis NBRC 103196]|nr:hypothetical protein AA103196_2967 [Ameyamaea chiangmaiensis NBRC 103196]